MKTASDLYDRFMNLKVEEYRRRQERIEDALRWYKQTKF